MTDSMFELDEILKIHVKRYPLIQPRDVVTLIYQNEFGGGLPSSIHSEQYGQAYKPSYHIIYAKNLTEKEHPGPTGGHTQEMPVSRN